MDPENNQDMDNIESPETENSNTNQEKSESANLNEVCGNQHKSDRHTIEKTVDTSLNEKPQDFIINSHLHRAKAAPAYDKYEAMQPRLKKFLKIYQLSSKNSLDGPVQNDIENLNSAQKSPENLSENTNSSEKSASTVSSSEEDTSKLKSNSDNQVENSSE